MRTLDRDPSQFENTTNARTRLADFDLEDAISRGYASTRHEDGLRSVWIFLRIGDSYNLLEEYRKARERRRADITPHGWFWSLAPGQLRQAIKFWHNFGPLGPPVFLGLKGADDYAWLDLGDFWNKLRRFRAVTKLWIGLEDPTALRNSWIELKTQLKQINAADECPFGSLRIRGGIGCTEVESPLLSQLETPEQDVFERWLEGVDVSTLRNETISLVECELNAQLGAVPMWRRITRTEKPGFHLTLIPNTLWSALWYFFALDTNVGVGWRICPHCGKLFYPPRRDRFYCTTELQVQHSRQRWWAEHKDEELAKRRAKRLRRKTANRQKKGVGK